MPFRYTAKMYFDNNEVSHESGDDADELYNWLLVKVQGKFGNWHGEVIDNKTHEVVKTFRKAPPD